MLTALHMSLTAKELLTNRHEIHFVSTQLGALVIQHLLLTCLLSFLHVPPVSKICHGEASMPVNVWKLNLVIIVVFIVIALNYQGLLNN